MKCPTCVAEGKESRVFPGMSMTTCMAFQAYYDEQGRHHSHDWNITTTDYSCSNGHSWTERGHGTCWC